MAAKQKYPSFYVTEYCCRPLAYYYRAPHAIRCGACAELALRDRCEEPTSSGIIDPREPEGPDSCCHDCYEPLFGHTDSPL